jgi:heavy metal sensor kinase
VEFLEFHLVPLVNASEAWPNLSGLRWLRTTRAVVLSSLRIFEKVMLDSVRIRLTLWYAGVLALSLVAFGVLTYYASARTFHARQDESLRSTAETVASSYMEELSEEGSTQKVNDVVLSQIVYPGRYVEIIDLTERAIAWSHNLAGHSLSVPRQVVVEAGDRGIGYGVQKQFEGDNHGLRVAVVPLSKAADKQFGYAVVAESLGILDKDLERLRNNFYAGIPIILLLASVGGYFLARKSLSPIALMDQQTRRITADNLSERLDLPNSRDELGRLATTINQLLGRLDAAFTEQQRFIADASHELRTPVAILRSEAEIALERDRAADEYKNSLVLISEEAERFSRIVEDLFTLARTGSSQPALIKERFYLNELLADCARAAQSLTTRKNVALDIEPLPEMIITGDEELLKRMLLNLLDNAVKYTPEGGTVSLALAGRDHEAEIRVSDTGIGIPVEDQAHIFDRFYRVDKARSRGAGGAGLGLAIARWIVEAHGGAISVQSDKGQGSVFRVILPLTE